VRRALWVCEASQSVACVRILYLRELRHELWDLDGEHGLHSLDRLHVQLWELVQVVGRHHLAELADVGEVAHRDVVGAVHLWGGKGGSKEEVGEASGDGGGRG
jgi:hypothetical protein